MSRLQEEAFMAEVQALREKLKDMELSCDFYPETPMRLIVSYASSQVSMDEDEGFSLELTMDRWDDVRYSFDGCRAAAIPDRLLNLLKNGFKKIAGAYLMMQHYIESEARLKPKEEV